MHQMNFIQAILTKIAHKDYYKAKSRFSKITTTEISQSLDRLEKQEAPLHCQINSIIIIPTNCNSIQDAKATVKDLRLKIKRKLVI